MWKAFLCRGERFALPTQGGIWLGDQSYAVWFPGRFGSVPAGRLAGRIGRAVVDGVAPAGTALRLTLDEGQAQVVVPVAPDPRAECLRLEGEQVGWAELGPLGRAARAAIRAAGHPVRAQVLIERGPRGGLRAVGLAASQRLEPVRLRGELPAGLILPAALLRLVWWSGFREGEGWIERAGEQWLVRCSDDLGREYRWAG